MDRRKLRGELLLQRSSRLSDAAALASCCSALRLFASDLRKFEWSYPHHTLKGAELAALQLQHKLSKHLSTSLHHEFGASGQALGIPEVVFGTGVLQRLARSSRQESFAASKTPGQARGSAGMQEPEDDEVNTQYSSVPPSLLQTTSVDGFVSHPAGDLDANSSVRPSLTGISAAEGEITSSGIQDAPVEGTPVPATSTFYRRPSHAIGGLRRATGIQAARGSQTGHGSQAAGDSQSGSMLPVKQDAESEREDGGVTTGHKARTCAESDQKLRVTEWMQRQESVGRNWDRTQETITALSLVKFSALLLEIVAKMAFVIEKGERLALLARFNI